MLARELRIPDTPECVAEIVDRGKVRLLDMGLVGSRRFLMVVSAGFDAMVIESIERQGWRPRGYIGYTLPILRVLRHYGSPALRVRVDEGERHEAGLVVVSNIRNYGGVFTMAERARCDSGRLDVRILPHCSVPRLVRYALAAFRGRLSKLVEVGYLTGERVQIESREPVAVEMDGDYFGRTPVVVEIRPASVPVVVPEFS
jgi:diacylglycerol kinase family enzyme